VVGPTKICAVTSGANGITPESATGSLYCFNPTTEQFTPFSASGLANPQQVVPVNSADELFVTEQKACNNSDCDSSTFPSNSVSFIAQDGFGSPVAPTATASRDVSTSALPLTVTNLAPTPKSFSITPVDNDPLPRDGSSGPGQSRFRLPATPASQPQPLGVASTGQSGPAETATVYVAEFFAGFQTRKPASRRNRPPGRRRPARRGSS
jgi:hypothetical protein